MKIEDIKGDFSYRENSIKWFTLENYLLVVKDEDHPDKIVTPLLYVDRKAGKAQNIDRYDMDKVLVNLNINKPELGFDRFENQYQVIKITYGNIIANNSDDENAPKCKTFANNLNPTSKNEIVEIIEADILEAEAKIRIKQPNLNTLLTDVYAKDSAPIFVETEGKIIGPFLIVGQEEANCFSIQKYLRKDFSFGEYRITNNTYVEFLHYNINRKLHVVGFNRLDFIQEIDFKDDKEILNEFVSRVSNSPELLNPEQMQQFLNLIDEVRNAKEIKNYIKDNKRVYDLLEKANEKLHKNVQGFTEKAVQKMLLYTWSGNLRELSNTVKRAALLTQGDYITENELPEPVIIETRHFPTERFSFSTKENERELIIGALHETHNNKTEAAKLLGFTRKTLYNKLKAYNIDEF